MIAFVIPHRDRARELARTLNALGTLDLPQGSEAIIVDNASAIRPDVPRQLSGTLSCRRIDLDDNIGAAARNVGAQHVDPRAEWIVMLDDDSAPVDATFVHVLDRQPRDVAAVMADIHLSDARGREHGGLPEVFIGCGVAIRRRVMLDLGGYDATFGYYVEEYDLAARMLHNGLRIVFEPTFRVEHRKSTTGRDLNVILHRLVRNNGWVIERYAPEGDRRGLHRETRRRYRSIAERESALDGYTRGLIELRRTMHAQVRTPLNQPAWDRFTGMAHARDAIELAWAREGFRTAAIVERGKNAWCVEGAIREMGVEIVPDPRRADVVVPGTMSPGPMIDAAIAWRARGRSVVAPWTGAWPFVRPEWLRGQRAA